MRALIVVDMQNDFVSGSLGSEQAQKIVFPARAKIERAIADKDDIYLTFDTHGEDYLETPEGRKLPVPHCVKGTKGHELHSQILNLFMYEESPHTRIEKPTFGSLELINTMIMAEEATGEKYDHIAVIGLCTDICVMANVVLLKTAFPDAEIIVDSSCCAGTTPTRHQEALNVMESLQVHVI